MITSSGVNSLGGSYSQPLGPRTVTVFLHANRNLTQSFRRNQKPFLGCVKRPRKAPPLHGRAGLSSDRVMVPGGQWFRPTPALSSGKGARTREMRVFEFRSDHRSKKFGIVLPATSSSFSGSRRSPGVVSRSKADADDATLIEPIRCSLLDRIVRLASTRS